MKVDASFTIEDAIAVAKKNEVLIPIFAARLLVAEVERLRGEVRLAKRAEQDCRQVIDTYVDETQGQLDVIKLALPLLEELDGYFPNTPRQDLVTAIKESRMAIGGKP